METLRGSTVQDIPRLRELWYLAFGDDGAYVDNFLRPTTSRSGCWCWRRTAWSRP